MQRSHVFAGPYLDRSSHLRQDPAWFVAALADERSGDIHYFTYEIESAEPPVIVLVSGAERALLGRQGGWPAGRYSTIAGFVEPGESLEDAVAREVFEERVQVFTIG